MPEEINRVLVDRLSDLLFTTERSAADNLRREGIDPGVFFGGVGGNVVRHAQPFSNFCNAMPPANEGKGARSPVREVTAG